MYVQMHYIYICVYIYDDKSQINIFTKFVQLQKTAKIKLYKVGSQNIYHKQEKYQRLLN